MPNKIKGLGTLLQVSISASYTTIAGRVSIDGPDLSMGETGISDLDSTQEEYGPTLPDVGEVGGTCWYNPNNTVHQKIVADLMTGAINAFKIVYADGMTTPAHNNFSGYFKKWKGTGMASGDYLQFEFSIRVTTAVTFTAGV